MTDQSTPADQIKATGGASAPRYCDVKPSLPVAIPGNATADRARAILMLANKWVNGTKLHYFFFADADKDGEWVTLRNGTREWRTYVGAPEQLQIVRAAFAKWKSLGIGLEFEETTDRHEAELRIGFMQGDGSWSYVGTDVLREGPDARTMNFGWDLRLQPDTAEHEIGHTLGLPHEHQNPNAGIVWDEEAVYRSLGGPPNNWSRDQTFHNIIRKIPPDKVQGSAWDPDSIMHYPFEAGLIAKPEQYRQGLTPAGGLSPRDTAWIRTYYPEVTAGDMRKLEPAVSQPLNVADGGQANFLYEATATRKYKVQTFGTCDTQIVLFEHVSGAWRYLAADDDSGEDRNALVSVRLRKGRRYAIRVRLKHSGGGTAPTVMLW